MNRYFTHTISVNDSPFYDKQIESRDLEQIRHQLLKNYTQLSREFVDKLEFSKDIWTINTSLYKLAHRYYNDQTKWWIIGMINLKPTDAHWRLGETVYIPINPGFILDRLGL